MFWICAALSQSWKSGFDSLSAIISTKVLQSPLVGLFGVPPLWPNHCHPTSLKLAFLTLLARRVILMHWKSVSPLSHPLDEGCFILYEIRENQTLPPWLQWKHFLRFGNPFKSLSSPSSWMLHPLANGPLNCTFLRLLAGSRFLPVLAPHSTSRLLLSLMCLTFSFFPFVLFFCVCCLSSVFLHWYFVFPGLWLCVGIDKLYRVLSNTNFCY